MVKNLMNYDRKTKTNDKFFFFEFEAIQEGGDKQTRKINTYLKVFHGKEKLKYKRWTSRQIRVGEFLDLRVRFL